MTLEELYGLDYPIKSLAVANPFVEKILFRTCHTLGQQLRPFCFYATEQQKQNGVIDFATFQGVLDQNKTLLDEIAEFRQELFKNTGIYVDIKDEVKKKLLFYDYLMSISICYVEIPKYVTKNNIAQTTFDKFFCTRNPALMGTWMGEPTSAMQMKHSPKILMTQLMVSENEIRFVTCKDNQKGNLISVPRKNFKVEQMTCVPLFMLNTFIEGFKPYLQDKILEFTFMKDNGTKRVVPTTLSSDILLDYYKDNVIVAETLANVDIDKKEQGALKLGSKMSRGYIKVPELGASIYDQTRCRSINVARILSVREVASVDRTFIHVALNQVVDALNSGLDLIVARTPEDLPEIFKDLVGRTDDSLSPTQYVKEIMNTVIANVSFLSTDYQRSLHRYMITHPHFFPNYTGMPMIGGVKKSAEDDFNLDIEDDIGYFG